MMGGILTAEQVNHFKSVMNWANYTEEDNIPDEIKLTLLDNEYRKTSITNGRDAKEVITFPFVEL